MKIALMQPRPAAGGSDATLSDVAGWAAAAVAQGSDLLLLPELLLPGYNRPDLHQAEAQPRDGNWSARMAQIARDAGLSICYGWAEREGAQVFNAASVIGADGATVAHYRKIQRFGAMERDSFAPGPWAPPVFDLAGRRCGMLICYDIEFPEHARALAKQGAELLLVPTANPQGFPHVPDLLVPARAAENRMIVAYANYAGDDHGMRFGGGSVVAGPDGQVLAKVGAMPAMVCLDLPTIADYPDGLLSTQIADLRLPD